MNSAKLKEQVVMNFLQMHTENLNYLEHQMKYFEIILRKIGIMEFIKMKMMKMRLM